jgi:hypothetical protein
LTHLLFGLAVVQVSIRDRAHSNLWLSEIVATFGPICTIALVGKKRVDAAPVTIALYIAGAYWFTSSMSFANPAVTIARSLTNSFCGIAPAGVLPIKRRLRRHELTAAGEGRHDLVRALVDEFGRSRDGGDFGSPLARKPVSRGCGRAPATILQNGQAPPSL